MHAAESISLADYRKLIATGGNVRMKVKRATPEEDLHRSCIEWVVLSKARYPILKWMTHVPNGGKRSKGEGGKLKALGVKPGYPDLTLPRKHKQWTGLAIELKSPTGRVTPEQQEWLDAFEEDGYLVGVARTLDEFLRLLGGYLNCTLTIA